MGEDAIDRSDLRVTEAIDIEQEQVRHLAENAGIVLGSVLFGAVQFLAQIRRSGRHGYPTSAPVVPARRMTPFPLARVMPSGPRFGTLPAAAAPSRGRSGSLWI